MYQGGENDFDVMPKIEDYDAKCSNVQEHVEERSRLQTQKVLSYSQMRSAGDGQPLREPLNQPEDYCSEELVKQTIGAFKVLFYGTLSGRY